MPLLCELCLHYYPSDNDFNEFEDPQPREIVIEDSKPYADDLTRWLDAYGLQVIRV